MNQSEPACPHTPIIRGSQTAYAMTLYNILGVYYLANVHEQIEGSYWYTNAQKVANNIADRCGINAWVKVAGVIAALSPNNRWERNCADAELVCQLYKAGGAEAALQAKVCTYKSNLVKAVKILESGLLHNIPEILNGPKVIEFYNCICGVSDVCIDGHAYAIWAGQRLTMKEIPNIGKKLREQIKADYTEAAKQVGIQPYELQAITWVAWRRLHSV